jgi:hypothetical protein
MPYGILIFPFLGIRWEQKKYCAPNGLPRLGDRDSYLRTVYDICLIVLRVMFLRK